MNYFKKERLLKLLKKTGVITMAGILYAVGIALFLDKNRLVPGGVSGLSMIIGRVTGIRTGTVIFLMNIPILAVGMWKFGIKLLGWSLYAIAITSIAVNLLGTLPAVTDDPLIAALAGGAVTAFCVGVILKQGATTGGMDIVVLLLKRRYRHLKTGTIYLMSDILVVSLTLFASKQTEETFYSALAVIAASYVMDMVLYGRDEAKLMYIMTGKEENERWLADKLLQELQVGVTFLQGYGAYRNTERRVLLCAVHKNLLPRAKEIVRTTDDHAFLIVTSANEIMGEGYKSYDEQNW